MYAPSRFRSARLQHAVVAAAMFMLLLGSVALAAQLGAARSRTALPSLSEVPADNLRFQVPHDWLRDQGGAGPQANTVSWTDPQRPTRRLALLRVISQERVDPRHVIQQFLPLLMEHAEQAVLTVDAALHPHPQLLVLEWAGASRATATEPRLHLAADLTLDQRTHYLFYLTDEVAGDEVARDVLLRNLALLRAVHQSARMLPPADARPNPVDRQP